MNTTDLNNTAYPSSEVPDFDPEECGVMTEAALAAISNCGFWVEGVAMLVLGGVALVTNVISIYAFTRWVLVDWSECNFFSCNEKK